jgi:hypothetical protein
MYKMANRAALLLILFTAGNSCKKEEAVISDATEIERQPGWESEKFKDQYTIQFPAFYTGGYVQGFEGDWFIKDRDDSRVKMQYTFNNGLQNFEFGDTLSEVSSPSILLPQGDRVLFLDRRINFLENGTLVGIFFHDTMQKILTGELYWLDGGVFKDALTVYYDSELQDEVTTILRTIRPE